MNKRSTGTKITLFMTVGVLIGFTIIIAMNVAALLGIVPSRYLSPNDVRGIAVIHQGIPYTLNFAQQNALLEMLNNTVPVGEHLVKERSVKPETPLPIEKIIIYRFSGPDIEIKPVAYVTKTQSVMQPQSIERTSLVLSIPAWNAQGLLEEATSDEMQALLQTTYDP